MSMRASSKKLIPFLVYDRSWLVTDLAEMVLFAIKHILTSNP